MGEIPWKEMPPPSFSKICQGFGGESLLCGLILHRPLHLWHLVFKLVDWKNAVWMSVFLSCHIVSSHSVLVFYIEDAFCSHNPFYRWRRLLRLKNLPKLEIVSVGNQGLHQICLILKHVLLRTKIPDMIWGLNQISRRESRRFLSLLPKILVFPGRFPTTAILI